MCKYNKEQIRTNKKKTTQDWESSMCSQCPGGRPMWVLEGDLILWEQNCVHTEGKKKKKSHAGSLKLFSALSNHRHHTYLRGRMKYHIHSPSKILCIYMRFPWPWILNSVLKLTIKIPIKLLFTALRTTLHPALLAAFPSHNNHLYSVEEQAQIRKDIKVADLSSLADCYLSWWPGGKPLLLATASWPHRWPPAWWSLTLWLWPWCSPFQRGLPSAGSAAGPGHPGLPAALHSASSGPLKGGLYTFSLIKEFSLKGSPSCYGKEQEGMKKALVLKHLPVMAEQMLAGIFRECCFLTLLALGFY